MSRPIELLAQADLLLLITDLFRPPEKIRRPLDSITTGELEALVEATGLSSSHSNAESTNKLNRSLIEQLQRSIQVAQDANQEEWAACFRLLFDSSMVCPVNEAGYVRRDKGTIIGDVCGFYHAFGWTAAADSGERPDHLLIEMEFAAMLLVMIARAESEEQSELTESALGEFTRHHMSDWLLVFCAQLKLSTTYPVFVEAANLLAIVWPALVDWHDWIVDPASPSTVGIASEPENPYECGAPDLVSIDTGETH